MKYSISGTTGYFLYKPNLYAYKLNATLKDLKNGSPKCILLSDDTCKLK